MYIIKIDFSKPSHIMLCNACNTSYYVTEKRINRRDGFAFKKQPFRGVLRKSCFENMQQIYRRTPMSKCDFNKVAKQLY